MSIQGSADRLPRLALVALASVLAWFVEPAPELRVALLLAALVMLWWAASGRSGRGLEAWLREGVLLAVAVAILIVGVKDDLLRLLRDGEVRVANVYHYYLGAKYSHELGYADLYTATLAADREGPGYWDEAIREARDLRTYEIVPRAELEARYQPEQAFSPGRWEAFKEDVEALSRHRRADRWRSIFRDRGYNATPLWTALGRALTAWIPASSPLLVLLASLDLVLLGLTAVLVAATFGRQRAILVLLLFVASPTNVARLTGGFLQADWLCAVACSICFYHRRRPWPAGALMAYAVMTRVFPLLLVVAACLPAIRHVLRRRRVPRLFARYLLSVVVFCSLGLVVGSASGRGPGAWMEFVEAIGLHRGQHVLGERRVGLEHAFTVSPQGFTTEIDRPERALVLKERQPVFRATQLLVVLLLVGAASRRRTWDGQLLGLAAVFSLLVLSRYYYGLLALMPLMSVHERFRRRLLVGGQVAAFLVSGLAIANGAGWHSSYALLNALLTIYFGAVLGSLTLPPNTLRLLVDRGLKWRPQPESDQQHPDSQTVVRRVQQPSRAGRDTEQRASRE